MAADPKSSIAAATAATATRKGIAFVVDGSALKLDRKTTTLRAVATKSTTVPASNSASNSAFKLKKKQKKATVPNASTATSAASDNKQAIINSGTGCDDGGAESGSDRENADTTIDSNSAATTSTAPVGANVSTGTAKSKLIGATKSGAMTAAGTALAAPAVLNVKPSHIKGKIESSRAVSLCVRELGWTEVTDSVNGKATTKRWTIGWLDAIDNDFFRALKSYQKVNHFPGIENLCRKKNLARHLNAMRRRSAVSDEYRFFPYTWILPQDDFLFKEAMETNAIGGRKHTFIVKPDGQCQGKGIFLARDSTDFDDSTTSTASSSSTSASAPTSRPSLSALNDAVAQLYVPNPYLLNGRKFDLRVYVLITSVSSLRIYLFNGGLTRFCTEPYQAPNDQNMSSVCTHLTNYALNKQNESFVYNTDSTKDDVGSKWTLDAAFRHLRASGVDINLLWSRIADVIVRTCLSVLPAMSSAYQIRFPRDRCGARCFQLLGFDILLDSSLHPWLIEINRSPSLAMDTPLDTKIKMSLVRQILKIVDPTSYEQTEAQAKESAREGRKLSGLAYTQWAAAERRTGLRARLAHERLVTRAADSDFQQIYPPVRTITHPIGNANTVNKPANSNDSAAATSTSAATGNANGSNGDGDGDGGDESSDDDTDTVPAAAGTAVTAAPTASTDTNTDTKSAPATVTAATTAGATAAVPATATAIPAPTVDPLLSLNTHFYTRFNTESSDAAVAAASLVAAKESLKPKALKALYKRIKIQAKHQYSQHKSTPLVPSIPPNQIKAQTAKREAAKASAERLAQRIASKQSNAAAVAKSKS